LLNNEGTEEGTLLRLLSRSITPFGKRLFRIWLCNPLQNIADINARLDAVQNIIDNPAFEDNFVTIAKGLPDLERIVSRIHGKSCKVRDFIKVLKVRALFNLQIERHPYAYMQSFKKLSQGLAKLANDSEDFDSKTILGLLRGAPDLSSNIKNMESMYQPVDDKG